MNVQASRVLCLLLIEPGEFLLQVCRNKLIQPGRSGKSDLHSKMFSVLFGRSLYDVTNCRNCTPDRIFASRRSDLLSNTTNVAFFSRWCLHTPFHNKNVSHCERTSDVNKSFRSGMCLPTSRFTLGSSVNVWLNAETGAMNKSTFTVTSVPAVSA